MVCKLVTTLPLHINLRAKTNPTHKMNSLKVERPFKMASRVSVQRRRERENEEEEKKKKNKAGRKMRKERGTEKHRYRTYIDILLIWPEG